MRRLGILALLAVLALPAVGADRDFKAVVKGIERQYGIRRSHPHLLGFALFFAKPATWGSGVHGLKLAVFEDGNRNSRNVTLAALDGIVSEALGADWRPFVRVQSRRDHESSVIYASCSGKQMKMLIASADHDGLAVVQMEMSESAIKRWAADPQDEARGASHRHEADR